MRLLGLAMWAYLAPAYALVETTLNSATRLAEAGPKPSHFRRASLPGPCAALQRLGEVAGQHPPPASREPRLPQHSRALLVACSNQLRAGVLERIPFNRSPRRRCLRVNGQRQHCRLL